MEVCNQINGKKRLEKDYRRLTGDSTSVFLTWWLFSFRKNLISWRVAVFFEVSSGFSEIRFCIPQAPLCNASANIH